MTGSSTFSLTMVKFTGFTSSRIPGKEACLTHRLAERDARCDGEVQGAKARRHRNPQAQIGARMQLGRQAGALPAHEQYIVGTEDRVVKRGIARAGQRDQPRALAEPRRRERLEIGVAGDIGLSAIVHRSTP